MTTKINSKIRADLVRKRDTGRLAEWGWHPGDLGRIPGGCGWLSEIIDDDYGWAREGGCYVTPEGHIDHYWNILPDGSIIDTTADQFGEPGDGIRIARHDDPRYLGTCNCPDWDGQIG